MSVVIKDLKKNFGTLSVLKGVSAEFKDNTITGYIGFNGSGKSTTFNIVANYIEDYQGQVLFGGQKWNAEIAKQISYLASGSEPKNKQKAINHLKEVCFMYGIKKKEGLAKIIEWSKKFEFEQYLPRKIGTLSAGNQQKIKLISALLNPDLKYLLLDEPFDAVDPVMTQKIQKVITGLANVTVVITSHQMQIVQDMCSAFYVLKDGVVVDQHENKKDTVTIAVNREVNTDAIAKMAGVVGIIEKNKEKLITVNDMSVFKEVNKLLVQDPNYAFSSIREKNIAKSVFEKYMDEDSEKKG